MSVTESTFEEAALSWSGKVGCAVEQRLEPCALATLRDTLLPKLLSGELSVTARKNKAATI